MLTEHDEPVHPRKTLKTVTKRPLLSYERQDNLSQRPEPRRADDRERKVLPPPSEAGDSEKVPRPASRLHVCQTRCAR